MKPGSVQAAAELPSTEDVRAGAAVLFHELALVADRLQALLTEAMEAPDLTPAARDLASQIGMLADMACVALRPDGETCIGAIKAWPEEWFLGAHGAECIATLHATGAARS